MRPIGGRVATISRPWYRRVRRPLTVPIANPPRPSVTSHSRLAPSSSEPHTSGPNAMVMGAGPPR